MCFYRPQRSWAKVMFLQASVILSTGGCVYPSKHCRWYPSMPCIRSRGGVYPSMHWRWYPSMPCSRSTGEGVCIPACLAAGIQGGRGVQAHTQRGNWEGSDPGPHPRGKLRGIRSRLTPKGEIEGDQIQAAGTHPTGMHSCFFCNRTLCWKCKHWSLHFRRKWFDWSSTSQT